MLIKPLRYLLAPSLPFCLSETFWSNLDFLWGRAFWLNALPPMESQREMILSLLFFPFVFAWQTCLQSFYSSEKGYDSVAITQGPFWTLLLSIRGCCWGHSRRISKSQNIRVVIGTVKHQAYLGAAQRWEITEFTCSLLSPPCWQYHMYSGFHSAVSPLGIFW